ncbi:MAG: alpha-glucosidase [Bacilli bacterium]|nr:alpha-glucosidase [Bacilli bacterium]
MAKRRNRWYKDAVIYQVYPRSFQDSNGDGIGDIPGIISRIPYIKSLGVDAVWLSPIYKSPNDDNGYDIADYTSIMKEFGTMEECRAMIKAFHEAGLKVIMDLVINHTSDEHAWFEAARKDPKSPYRNYYFFRKGRGKKHKRKPNNWTSFFGGSAWEYNPDTDDFYLHLFSKKQPDLNFGNEAVVNEVIKIMEYWAKEGIDGFRCDVFNVISKAPYLPNGEGHFALVGKEHYLNGPHVHELYKRFNQQAFAKYDLMTVGEAVMMTPDVAVDYIKEEREELDMLFTFDHQDADNHMGIKYLRKKFNFEQFKHSFEKWQRSMEGVGWTSLYLENHDQPRSIGRFNTEVSQEYHDVGCTMLATMLFFHRGTPYIYEGEEIGMTGGAFNDVSELRDREAINMLTYAPKLGVPKPYIKKSLLLRSRDNARTPMQWDDSAYAGFSKQEPWLKVNPNYATINVKNNEADPNSVLNYYRKLIKVRKGNETIINGTYTRLDNGSKSLYIYARKYEHEVILCIANFTKQEQPFTLMDEYLNKPAKLLIANYEREVNLASFTLKPYEARVYTITV